MTMTGMTCEHRTYEAPRPAPPPLTLGPPPHGASTPTSRSPPAGGWRATRPPQGPATVRLQAAAPTDPTGCSERFDAWAWGPGASWALERVPDLLGHDDDGDAPTDHPVVGPWCRTLPGLRMSRSHAVTEALIP